ncbi:hypothetical protein [Halorhodospira halochloris]|uniref:hypothetical protein n=1 Tax=Halorhodospira halochloris TaxID=1052 RepID=UPI0013A57184|nr:hypothetical protein [Halorhodospira halochloris]
MNPSLEASWRHPWRQDLHTGADGGASEVLEVPKRLGRWSRTSSWPMRRRPGRWIRIRLRLDR